jgi:hypothetical protein
MMKLTHKKYSKLHFYISYRPDINIRVRGEVEWIRDAEANLAGVFATYVMPGECVGSRTVKRYANWYDHLIAALKKWRPPWFRWLEPKHKSVKIETCWVNPTIQVPEDTGILHLDVPICPTARATLEGD